MPYGAIDQSVIGRKNDYLFRLSLKALIVNVKDEVLVVKDAGRDWWDLPGGGMDHYENTKNAIARELHEEVGLNCDFTYSIIDVDEPAFLEHANVWQVRLIFKVVPQNMDFIAGEDGDEIMFIDPRALQSSSNDVERRIMTYWQKANEAHS